MNKILKVVATNPKNPFIRDDGANAIESVPANVPNSNFYRRAIARGDLKIYVEKENQKPVENSNEKYLDMNDEPFKKKGNKNK